MMQRETREFLDRVACVAEGNPHYLHELDGERLKPRDQGANLLMSAYLELYGALALPDRRRSSSPSELVRLAAETRVAMRREMHDWPRETWREPELGLHNLMLAFMFLFKRLFVAQH